MAMDPNNSSRFVKGRNTALAIAMALGLASEGVRLHSYYDVGHVPTICMGETHGVFPGMTKTLQECKVMFSGAMNQRVLAVQRMLTRKEPMTLQAALADFAYNEGVYRLQHSAALLLINQGREVEGCDHLLDYTKAAGKHLAGLETRRIRERNVCLVGFVKGV